MPKSVEDAINQAKMSTDFSAESPPKAEDFAAALNETDSKLTKAEKTLRESLVGVYTAMEIAAYMVDTEAARAIKNNKNEAADAWIALSQSDPKIRSMLMKLTSTSKWAPVIMVHAAMLWPIFDKVGIIPGGALIPGLMNRATAKPEPIPVYMDAEDDVSANGSVAFS